jgi:PAS domain S-box-containing protein
MKQFEDLTKEQLINDLVKFRQRIEELEKFAEDSKKHLDELHKTRAMYEGLFEFAPDAIVVVDRQGRIVQANKQLERLFGYTREELFEADHDILLPERFREIHKAHRAKYMAEPRVRPMGTGLELYGRRKDGSEFPVDIALGVLKPMQNESDIVVLAVIRDVTERKQREEKLVAMNRELDTFAHAVSHDLKAPLRRIEGFIQALSEDYSDKLDEKGKDYILRARAASQRMQNLTDALLQLSRFATGELHRSPVYLSTMVKTAAAELAQTSRGRLVEFVIAEDVKAEADPAMLHIVLENLIENAWKFTAKKPEARIEFGATRIDGKNAYFVRDNGSGFDMQHMEGLFTPFRRLHSEDEFPGIGIGLATVQRVIQRHGGRIWAEGEVDKGATFYFTLD